MIQLKTPEQIDGIRRSCKLLASLLDTLDGVIKPGMSTFELNAYCHDFIIKHKGRPAFLHYNGFPASACISLNEEVIHGIPSKKRIIGQGDLVSVDLGIVLDGYVSDSARTFIAGGTDDEQKKKLVRVTRECLDKGIAAIRPGGRVHDISQAVYKHANANGFGVVRVYCGHGVGLALHEDPEVPNYVNPLSANPRLRPGMTLAIEPMINMGTKNVYELEDGWTVVTADEKPSAHFEHTVAITEKGVEILTLVD